MTVSRFADHVPDGTHASRPVATAVADGTLYACSTHGLVYQSDGATWATWLTPTGGTPSAHASSHIAAGSDPLTLDDSQVTPVTPNDQTGTTYTFVLADKHRLVTGTNASAQTFTIPLNATVAYPLGTALQIYQKGAGQITVAITATGTLRTPRGAKTAVQYALVTVVKTDTDTWVVAGDATA